MSKITPHLWFPGNAEEAVQFYLSVFPDAKVTASTRYPTEGLLDFQKPFAGKILTIAFELFGQSFVAINAGPEFPFTEAVSFHVACRNQAEIDRYWSALTEGGGEESQCGWCKDKFGLSWQITPANIDELMQRPGAWEKLLGMGKIEIAELTGN